MTEKLKPCPFCGGKAEVSYQDDVFFRRRLYSVKCGEYSDCMGSMGWCNTEEEAVELWNRRVPVKISRRFFRKISKRRK